MQTILINAVRLVDNRLQSCEIRIENGVIQEIGDTVERQGEAETINCHGNLITPGFVDVHVHLREPGGEAKETIETGTKAAARGGYTTICAMPNTRPVPEDVTVVESIYEKIKETASIRVLPYGSITKRLLGKELTDAVALKEAGVFALTDDGVGVQSADQMLQAMKQAKAANLPIVAHCEENTLIHNGVIHEGATSERLGVPGIPSICESVQIARDVLLAEATGCHYHVCHVSTKESVRVIRDAKRAGIHVTAEVTPHHLLLNETAIQSDDGNVKMNPPLRSKTDQQALLEGLVDGTIDFIATDHAPHTEEEKNQGLKLAPFGIVGLETAFSLLYTHLVKTEKLTLQQLVDFLTIKPAQVFNMPYGALTKGAAADITVINLSKREKIDTQTFLSKGKNTPFHDWDVEGIPVLTIVEGKIVFEEAAHGKTKTRA
ncbi:dihydroorotase [Aquibacillus sp. 3ASR75-11]|uniref:Dihydroorotase n=1 Tax=Terrihalobacillus insolitus TaxID=2950438 RepID=A0A9X4AMN0_9BACI|nr:dihydroorotase [Terrihalobacillus insolitus]MDC3412856.1 dihydroorotase [Terrihalobacillus insolitus]MDC3423668.1 dihydroorotase [Terrihalobacillus insolitus]